MRCARQFQIAKSRSIRPAFLGRVSMDTLIWDSFLNNCIWKRGKWA